MMEEDDDSDDDDRDDKLIIDLVGSDATLDELTQNDDQFEDSDPSMGKKTTSELTSEKRTEPDESLIGNIAQNYLPYATTSALIAKEPNKTF